MSTTLAIAEPYSRSDDGVFLPHSPIAHRDEEYDPTAFDLLLRMQQRHFWYQGRHRFLYRALRQALGQRGRGGAAVDLGGGCGGWVNYLLGRPTLAFDELALADSSLRALEHARGVLGPETPRYQIDLLNLQWERRWDVAFLLDVLEHIPQDEAALRQIFRALRRGDCCSSPRQR